MAFQQGQELAFDVEGVKLRGVVESLMHISSDVPTNKQYGILITATALNWTTERGANVKLDGSAGAMRNILPKDFDFAKLVTNTVFFFTFFFKNDHVMLALPLSSCCNIQISYSFF